MIRVTLCAACGDDAEVKTRNYRLFSDLSTRESLFEWQDEQGASKSAGSAALGLTGIDTTEAMAGHSASLSFTLTHPWGKVLRDRLTPQDMVLVEALTPGGAWDTLFDGFVSQIRWSEEGSGTSYSSHFSVSCEGAHRLLNQGWENWQGVIWAVQSKIGEAGEDALKEISVEKFAAKPEEMVAFLLDFGINRVLNIIVPGRKSGVNADGRIGMGWMKRADGLDWTTDFGFALTDQKNWYLRQSGSFASIIHGITEPDIHEFFLTYRTVVDPMTGGKKASPTWVFRPHPFPGVGESFHSDPEVPYLGRDDDRWIRLASEAIVLGVDGAPGCRGANGTKSDGRRANVFHWVGASASAWEANEFYGKLFIGCQANESHIRKYGYCARVVRTSVVGLSERENKAWFLTVAPKLVERVAWQDSPLPFLEQQSRHYTWLPSKVAGLHIGKVIYDGSGQRPVTGYLVSVRHTFKASANGLQAFTTLGIDRACPGVKPLDYPDKVRGFAKGMQRQEYASVKNGRNSKLRAQVDARVPLPKSAVGKFTNPTGGTVGDRVGQRMKNGKWTSHNGTDIKTASGSPVICPAQGVVMKVDWSDTGGNCVWIRDEYGFVHILMHMLEPSTLVAGDSIARTAPVGKVGSTGSNSTGPHLHWEVRDASGRAVDPIGI